MECIYYPDLTNDSDVIRVDKDEFKHIKALRLKEGDFIALSNGKGLIGDMQIVGIKKDSANLKLIRISEKFGELNNRFALALAILSDRTRYEFALEKAVELGITDFFPLITDYCEKKSINIVRLEAKAIAAMKQTKRSILPKIHKEKRIKELVKISDSFKNIILTDWDGKHPNEMNINGDTLVLVGPEGGFSDSEIDFVKANLISDSIRLGKRRLRAETASTAVLSILSMKLSD